MPFEIGVVVILGEMMSGSSRGLMVFSFFI